jgi:hypothetical protein
VRAVRSRVRVRVLLAAFDGSLVGSLGGSLGARQRTDRERGHRRKHSANAMRSDQRDERGAEVGSLRGTRLAFASSLAARLLPSFLDSQARMVAGRGLLRLGRFLGARLPSPHVRIAASRRGMLARARVGERTRTTSARIAPIIGANGHPSPAFSCYDTGSVLQKAGAEKGAVRRDVQDGLVGVHKFEKDSLNQRWVIWMGLDLGDDRGSLLRVHVFEHTSVPYFYLAHWGDALSGCVDSLGNTRWRSRGQLTCESPRVFAEIRVRAFLQLRLIQAPGHRPLPLRPLRAAHVVCMRVDFGQVYTIVYVQCEARHRRVNS